MTKTSSPPRPVPRVSLTRADAAKALGISLRAVAQLISNKASGFPHFKLGSKTLIPLAELENWVRDQMYRDKEKGGQL
jgi:excisionase family DNA binding protein